VSPVQIYANFLQIKKALTAFFRFLGDKKYLPILSFYLPVILPGRVKFLDQPLGIFLFQEKSFKNILSHFFKLVKELFSGW
jgi:hypothetical protein